jgi:hypothetical protein
MKTNVFFVNGLMSTIVASVIAEKLHAKDTNVLCVERVINVFKKDYYKLNRMIETYFPWAKIFYIDRDSHSNLLKRHIIRYYNAVKYYKSFKKHVNDSLGGFGKIDQIYATTPSMMWSLVDTKAAELNIIEHSIQEYNFFNSMRKRNNPVTLFKRFFDLVIGYRFMGRSTIPSRFIFLDGGRCQLIKGKRLENDISSTSISAIDLIPKIFKHVEIEYQMTFPKEYEEIMNIRAQLSHFERKYIYLPAMEVPQSKYVDYLESQTSDVSLNQACVLIKNHPIDSNGYSQYFGKYNCKVLTIKHEMNQSLPVELLMVMLDMPALWGSYSSSLIYSYWWLGAEPILSEGNSPIARQIAIKEYKQFMGDFEQFKTTKRADLLNPEYKGSFAA